MLALLLHGVHNTPTVCRRNSAEVNAVHNCITSSADTTSPDSTVRHVQPANKPAQAAQAASGSPRVSADESTCQGQDSSDSSSISSNHLLSMSLHSGFPPSCWELCTRCLQ
ncbi:unnamed protein product [Pleuronectes platessa]|uniref:Uncharacterized protein n=1 Tax=Pleuronectes platessa TaxID=8262 RepID=A0A9N7TGV8_PLEPL|nr:unnamed protein product [Pleuronectes platessa]